MNEPNWISAALTFDIHDMQIEEHGGASGVKDEALLQSALARPRNHYAYNSDTDIFHLAASLTFGIVRNHPFVDGNKRTGFMTGYIFLGLNGYDFDASNDDIERTVFALAAGEVDEATLAQWMRENSTAI